MGYQEMRKAMESAERVRRSEMIAMDNTTYHYKTKYCIDCKYFVKRTMSCKKNRVVRVCKNKFLKNKE